MAKQGISPWDKTLNMYRKTSSISRTLVGNNIFDNSDVVGASPVGAAPTTSSFWIEHLASIDWAKQYEYEYEIFIAQISQGYIEVHKYIQ